MPATPVYIVCSPRPQVGKTLIARLLSEFLLLKNGRVVSFDISLKEPSLLDYLPDITETADVIDTYGKMQLMDRIIVDDGLAKVIDLGFHAFDEFFKMSDQIGFMKEAARRNVAPVVLFMADTDRVSGRAHEMLRQQIPPANLMTVDNEFVVRGELLPSMSRRRRPRAQASGSSPRTTYSLSTTISWDGGMCWRSISCPRADTRSGLARNNTMGAMLRLAASFRKPISSDILKNSSKAWKPRSITLLMPSSTMMRSISCILP